MYADAYPCLAVPTGLPYQREPKWTWRVMADVPKGSKEREICLFCSKYIRPGQDKSIEPKTWAGHPCGWGRDYWPESAPIVLQQCIESMAIPGF